MINFVIYAYITKYVRKTSFRTLSIQLVMSAVIVAAVMLYGYCELTRDDVETGLKLSVVQGNIEQEKKGQFPSKNCECHYQEPYGFVPEVDCPEHDTKQFMDFMEKTTNLGKKAKEEEVINSTREEVVEEIREKILKITESGFDCICHPYAKKYFSKLSKPVKEEE